MNPHQSITTRPAKFHRSIGLPMMWQTAAAASPRGNLHLCPLGRGKETAFSLIELSIVFVILGLLVGGILAGQSLIRASELRSVTTDVEKYTAATKAFKTRYESLPGDMPDATAFWGKDNTNCPTHTGSAATPGTCNGNGDGMLTSSVASAPTEVFQYWKQLALAGLIEGNYSGLSGAAGAFDVIPGTNAPRGKISNSSWEARWLGIYGGDAELYAMDFGHLYMVGAESATGGPSLPILTPEQAWNIDTKLDDGKPAYGKIIARYWNDACAAADDGTSANNDLNASYRLSDSRIRCALVFIKQF
jgi:hypothetical protein